MSRIAYVNGRYVHHRDASVHVEDRGYQFSDGVYEVVALHKGRMVDEKGHLDRLERSLSELQIAWPLSRRSMQVAMREVVRRNGVRDGILYMQVTRGVSTRNHVFPDPSVKSSFVMTARRIPPVVPETAGKGVKVITVSDIRWKRPDIKAVSLLPNVLAKQKAQEAGAYEAWQVDAEGYVTEGTLSNAWIVTADGQLVTRFADFSILRGITRMAVMEVAQAEGITFVERSFTVAEAKAAREAFLTSSTSPVKPVVQIDDDVVADGNPGPICRKLLDVYIARMERPEGTP